MVGTKAIAAGRPRAGPRRASFSAVGVTDDLHRPMGSDRGVGGGLVAAREADNQVFEGPCAVPHFITFANEKGGTGKSTTAVHSAVALAAQGRKVAALDLDTRQRTLGRYLDNRAATMRRLGPRSADARLRDLRSGQGRRASTRRSSGSAADAEIVVIDTPGRDDPLQPRRDGPRRHAGDADQRQLRRSRPDRRGRRRDLSRCAGRASMPSWSGTAAPSAPRHTAPASTGWC